MNSFLQQYFHDYLKYLVEQSTETWDITYHTTIPERGPEKIRSTPTPEEKGKPLRQLEFRVLNPAFYSRFVHYSHTSEALDRECLFTDTKNRTLWISHPELLPLLLPKSKSNTLEDDKKAAKRTWTQELRWNFLRKLRCPPAAVAYPDTPPEESPYSKDIRSLPFSDLDVYVRNQQGNYEAAVYRRSVTKLFLASRLTFGFTELFDLFDLGLRVLLCYVGVLIMTTVSGRTNEEAEARMLSAAEAGRLAALGIGICSVHIYGLAKGYA